MPHGMMSVAITLEKVDENAIAKQLRDNLYLTNVKTKEQTRSIREIANPPITGLATSSIISECVPVSSEIEEVAIEEDVVTKLDSLEQSFCVLTCEVKSAVEATEEKNDNIKNIVFHVQQARSFCINSLQSVKTTDELFEAIYPHYNFLNCHLIIRIALFLCGIIAEKATEYKEDIMKFMKTTKITHLKDELKRYHRRKFPSQRENHYMFIEIKVENGWGDQPLLLVEMLLKTLFPVKHPDELPWYDIVPGSVIMTFIVLEHMTSSLIESSRKKTEFMRLIGVISLKIGDELVWQLREDGDAVLSFEDSLIRATLANNIEVVQFILQYTQVDINTRNTSHTLIVFEDKVFCESIIENLNSYYTIFVKLLKNVEHELHQLMDASVDDNTIASIRHPSSNFMNYAALVSVSHLLPVHLATRVKKYKAALENFVKKRSEITFLETYLNKYFPTPFPDSIEVIISLHSVWSTCSVWYFEQLGQLIFTPTQFYQLQWFRVNRREESVRVCLLADGKIMNSLKECISDNESRTSMLGVISVQIDDTVMIFNDYCDGYNLNEAMKLAKAIGDDEISEQIQQMLLSPKEYREVSKVDNNNNLFFSPDPDSTPLMIACCNDNSQLVQLLLDHNVDPNIRSRRDNTALIYSTGNSKIFKILLDHGADINISNFFNYTTLHFASWVGNFKVVKIILDMNSEFVHALSSNYRTPFDIACEYRHMEIVERLLQAKADPNVQDNEGFTPLLLASMNGDTEIVEALLRANADPNIKDIEDWTPLYGATSYGHTAIAEKLLMANADPNIRDDGGLTPLNYASLKGHTKIVESLLLANANPNNQSDEGLTPLNDAIRYGHKEIVERLLNAKADPNIQDKEGKTPLISATQYYHTDIVDKLLKANADPDISSNNRQTALMFACANRHIEITELLLEAGADPDFKNKEGQTALDLAMETGNNEFIERLCSALFD